MTQQLDALLGRHDIRLRVFFAGNLCQVTDFDAQEGAGHLHVLRKGELTMHGPHAFRQTLREPSLVCFPKAVGHRLVVDEGQGAELVCASAQFDAPFARALIQALPDVLVVPLHRVPRLEGVLQVMFDEAFDEAAGPGAVLDRLCEVVFIQLMRWAVDSRMLRAGVVGGMADARLSKALAAIHNEPQRPWTLQELADSAGLSRARFAAQFSEVVGKTPGDYLAAWRVSLAQSLLVRGRQLKSIADECGYGSANALSRAFLHHVGVRPTEWLAARRGRESSERRRVETSGSAKLAAGHAAATDSPVELAAADATS